MNNLNKDIEIVKKFIEETQEEYSETLVDGKAYRIENIPLEFKPTKELANSISNVLSELQKKDNIIFETKKYLENMTKSSIRDKDGYYLGNWYVLEPYELEDVIDILKGKENDE